MNAHDLSVGVFIRGLSNLNSQLVKAQAHASANGGDGAALLRAQIASDEQGAGGAFPGDLHRYTLAAHVHWAAEGARLAIALLLGAHPEPSRNVAPGFPELRQHVDATIAYLRGVEPGDLEAGLDRTIVVEHRRGSSSARGDRFLVAFAIPHFYYHVTNAYGIMRNQGVPLTMGDFLGDWSA